MTVIDTDVIVVGAAPTGLMLARELCLAGVRPLVLERLPQPRPCPAPRFPFGGIHVDLTQLAESPMEALLLPQPQLERLLEELAAELGATINRGVFAIASVTPNGLSVYTSEEGAGEYDGGAPMTVTEFQDSVRRVLGADLPLGESTLLSRFTYDARQVDRYRLGRILVAGDAVDQFPSGGVALNAGMLDTVDLVWKLAAEIDGWAPPGLLDTYHAERHLAGARTAGTSSPNCSSTNRRSVASEPSSQVPTSATQCPMPTHTPWQAPSHPTSPCTPTKAQPASRNYCMRHGPSFSTSETDQSSAKRPAAGSR